MSKKEKKNVEVVENIKDENVANELVENWIENANEPTTTPDETPNNENWTNPDETKPENDEQKDENEQKDEQKDEDGQKDEEENTTDENVEKENVEWKIHVKCLMNRWSFKKNCEYYVSWKIYELYENLFEVLD